jgi:hypothetical protein
MGNRLTENENKLTLDKTRNAENRTSPYLIRHLPLATLLFSSCVGYHGNVFTEPFHSNGSDVIS